MNPDVSLLHPLSCFAIHAVLDASGKFGSSGIFEGNLNAIGTFDECLPIEFEGNSSTGIDCWEIPSFEGKFFVGEIKLRANLSRGGDIEAFEGYGMQPPSLTSHPDRGDYGIDWEKWGLEDNYLLQDIFLVRVHINIYVSRSSNRNNSYRYNRECCCNNSNNTAKKQLQ